MHLHNFSIDRIVIHQVYQRDPEGTIVEPFRSYALTLFDDSAMSAFRTRVSDALGDGSKAVPMEIVTQDKDKIPHLVDKIISVSDEDFVLLSYEFAKKLAEAQNNRAIPGGIIVIFTGKQGYPAKRFLGIIKADIYSAYEKQQNIKTGEISLKFVKEALLTPSSKLYKTAAFYEKAAVEDSTDLNNRWAVTVSDYQINQADGKAAAKYFYSSFLGCGYPKTSARTTKQFYDATCSFIRELDYPEEKKSDILNALITYLKTDNASSIEPKEFGQRYFEVDLQDDFVNYLVDKGLPKTAFTKDIAHIESKLKLRKLNFSKNVKISAPADIFKELITVESIEGTPDEAGTPAEWTRITIKDRISTQE